MSYENRVERCLIYGLKKPRWCGLVYFLPPKTLVTASTTSLACGSAFASNVLAYGMGTSTPATRQTGASKWKKVSSSITRAQISEPTPEIKSNRKPINDSKLSVC